MFRDSHRRSASASPKEARPANRVRRLLAASSLDDTTPHVEVPQCLSDLKDDIVNSGIAVLPGTVDRKGSPLVVVSTAPMIWQSKEFSHTDLSKILLFYHSIYKEDFRKKGLAVIVDGRSGSAALSVLTDLLEALYAVESTRKNAITTVHVIADKYTQSLLFKCQSFKPQGVPKIDLFTSVDKLQKYIDKAQLPTNMGGTHSHNHTSWVQFRTELESFTINCRIAARFLVGVMQEMSDYSLLPKTLNETNALIERHENSIKKAFDDPRVTHLQTEWETFHKLVREKEAKGLPSDFLDAVETAKVLYKEVHDTVFKLVKLADERVHRLEQCHQLRNFEAECTEVLNWMKQTGQVKLTLHEVIADTLKGIRIQQKNFDKFYFQAMTQIEKANDLMEESGMLAQSGEYGEAAGIQDIGKTLKRHMHTFTTQLEHTRETIEDTSKCYHLLDKSYDWALRTMKYVSGIKIESDATVRSVLVTLKSLDIYLENHPYIKPEGFSEMLYLAEKLTNEKLLEQCKMAKVRCEETENMIKMRREALQKAKEQLLVEEKRRSLSRRSPSPAFQDQLMFPRDSSTPTSRASGDCPYQHLRAVSKTASDRRQSYAGMTSAPGHGIAPTAINARKSEPIFHYEQRKFSTESDDTSMFQNSFITQDMSDRVVASLPKVLTDGVFKSSSQESLRSSQDSLHRSRESLNGSNENLNLSMDSLVDQNKIKSFSLPKEISFDNYMRRRNKPPARKVFKRSNTASAGMDHMDSAPLSTRLDHVKHRWSLHTGSTESLPSMREMEEESLMDESDIESSKVKSWSPVPVNTHLLRQSKQLTHHSSMADLRLTEAEIKSRRVLAHVMAEMIQTERDYVQSLNYIIENYIPEIMRDDVPQALRGKRNVIFGNIENIHQFHSQHFLKKLINCENSPFQICRCFLDHEDQFYLYALYNKNKPKSDALMLECGAEFFKAKQRELADRMDLNSYLLKPVQRMGKYALLLKQIIKECPESDPDFGDLKSAEEMVKFQLRHGNDLLAMDSLRDCDVNLQEQGRLLRQNKFLVWTGRKKVLRHVFMFEHLVVFSKAKHSNNGHEVYIYKQSLKTSDLGLTENIGESGYKFELWFRKNKPGSSFVLQAQSVDIKNAWVHDISRLLWAQAFQNREMRLKEMSSMGIGNKPCLDLKTSEDNINDRFVNVSVSSNPKARYRNSVSGMPSEHTKGQKRPHSIISVSSSSSSSSSGSGGNNATNINQPYPSLFSNLNLTLGDPDKYNKSNTISSNESGVCMDTSMDYSEDLVMPNDQSRMRSNSAICTTSSFLMNSTASDKQSTLMLETGHVTPFSDV
ncbi:pleckstrin homology domain-containing family G member 4B-like [Tubulanus polymorphus]|uniref:pleckstrin homology domain-containing family G member 4B-like n=1 Tax=Tubulanus polymorphus TaxID=672921 RepID=UPI003DA36FE8